MTRFSLSSLRVRVLLLVLLTILPAFGLLLYTALEQRRLAAAEAQQEALRLARLAAGDQERFVEQTRALLALLAQVSTVRGAEPGCNALLARLQAENPAYTGLGVTNLSGDPICGGFPITGPLNVADRTWFQRALTTRAFAVGDYQIGRVTGKAILPFGYPILDDGGQIRLVLFASLDLAWINRVAAHAQLPAGWVLTVVDQNGTVIARHPDPEKWVGKPAPEVPVLRAVATRQGEGTALAADADGVRHLYAFTLLPGTPSGSIFVIVGVPTDAAFADANRILLRNLLAFGIACMVALAAAWVGTDLSLLRRVRALVTATNRVAAGDLSARTELRYGIGELSQLSRAFDEMAERLEARQREARQAQEALRQSEKRYREVVENGLGLICTHDLDGTLLSINAPAAHQLGYQSAELVGRNMRDFIAPWARHLFDEYLRRLRQEPVIGGTMRVVTRDGEERVWVYRSRRVEEGGRPSYVIGHAQDMTERRRAEEALRESEERFRALAVAAPIGIFLTKPTGECIYTNPLWSAISGLSSEESLGYGWTRSIHPDDQEKVKESWLAAAARGESYVTDYRIIAPAGDLRWVHALATPQLDASGSVVSYVGSVEDITERKQAEEAFRRSEKLAAMGELLAGVAHELNNPLSVIVGQTGLLRQTVHEGAVAERLNKVAQAADRCARIVKKFLALAYPHAAERRRIGLNQIVQEAVDLLAYELRVDNVEVRLDLAPALPVLWADPHQLQQVVVNLITNAHQAMREVSWARRLTLTSHFEPTAARVRLEVADTGPGIPEEIRPQIFEPFFTTKPPGRGTGLGLSLCQGIIEGHGGAIEVESTVGQGTVFRIELPVDESVATTPEIRETQALPRIRGKTILVVDDEPGVTAVLVELLSRDAHHVETAPNGSVALAKLDERTYDLILSDVRMPELDGPGLYREVASRYPKLSRRVIFITGDSVSPETREFLAEAGVPSLDKPFELEDVRQVVQQALRAPST